MDGSVKCIILLKLHFNFGFLNLILNRRAYYFKWNEVTLLQRRNECNNFRVTLFSVPPLFPSELGWGWGWGWGGGPGGGASYAAAPSLSFKVHRRDCEVRVGTSQPIPRGWHSAGWCCSISSSSQPALQTAPDPFLATWGRDCSWACR